MDYAGSSAPIYVPDFRRRKPQAPTPEDFVSDDIPVSDVSAFQRELVEGGQEAPNRALVPRGAKSAAFMQNFDGTKYLPNDRANRVRLEGGEAMTPEQRGQVIANARQAQGYKAPLRATINGQSYEMPASGPRVSQDKAKTFLAMAQQEKMAAEAKAERDRQFQAEQIARQAAADRQAKLDDMASLDRRERRIAERDTRNAQMERESYAFGRQKAQDVRADAGRLTPEQERARAAMQAIITNPNASPRAKALATAQLAAMSSVSGDIAAELSRPSAQENAAPVMDAINNDPLIAGRVVELQKAVSRAQDLPWYHDLGDAFKFGLFEPTETDPAAVAAIKEEVDAIARQAADQYGLDLESVRTAIANQVLSRVTDATPGPAKQIRGALRAGQARPAAPAAPAASGNVAQSRLPGGGPAF